MPLMGCTQFKLAIGTPWVDSAAASLPIRHNRMVLVSYQEPVSPKTKVPHAAGNAVWRQQAEQSTVKTNEAVKNAIKATVDEIRVLPVEKKPTYTSPGLPYQQLAVAVAAVAMGVVPENDDSLGREFSESIAFSAAGSIGRLGLTAPPTRLAGRVTSRPGLQDGPATGLGFTSMDRNIFTLQVNRLSGATGRCQDLARAGFFGGSQTNCEQSFRRR